MTDVRLTATNPEDSRVVPVACNEKGELKLEEPVVFDGNFDGDLNVTGSGTFEGVVSSRGIKHPAYSAYGYSLGVNDAGNFTSVTFSTNYTNPTGGNNANKQTFKIVTQDSPEGSDTKFAVSALGDVRIGGTIQNSADTSTQNILLSADGSSLFKGDITVNNIATGGENAGISLRSLGTVAACRTQNQHPLWTGYIKNTDTPTSTILADGSCLFAGGKAGFTKEGNLFCTTTRGDLVVLENTSGGFGAWVEYDPSKHLLEKLEEWSEKDKKPSTKPGQE